jgi:halocyanin-like protein
MRDYDISRRDALIAGGTALTASMAGCLGGGGDDGDDGGNGDDNGNGQSPEEIADSYLSDNSANLYGGTGDIVDETGSDAITIEVGAGDGLAFDPPAVRVASGTEITWEWTGNGGNHNVVLNDGPSGGVELDSGDPVQEEGTTYSETLDTTGVYRYRCVPHQAQGMHGAVIVE